MFSDYLAVLCQGNVRRDSRKGKKVCQCEFGLQHVCMQCAEWLKRLSEYEEVHLGMLIATYDQLTNEHARRTMDLAGVVARQMQCSGEEIIMSCLAALLHDIGKAAIPSLILAKPGPLSKEEWQIMRLHPGIGGQMLQQAGGIFEKLEHIVVAHHERWDGTGYPFGLAGEEIPLLARILTVVDSFDAMTTSRVYQQRLSVGDARQELLCGAGSQYDPGVVAIFISLLDQGRERFTHYRILSSERKSALGFPYYSNDRE
jgi:HD-GYP domain-containing protein (c-di-GMP phosphodiesterase class II)